MEGQRTSTNRTERGKRARRSKRFRTIWWLTGAALVALFMTQNNLMNATGVLAILGVIEVASKAWQKLGEKIENQ